MQSFRSSSAERQLSPNAGEMFITFAFKVIIPLIPIATIFWLCSLIMNMEISGTYRGFIPGKGTIVLNLIEDNEQLTGELSLKKNRYVISEGKMLGDNKMQMTLRKELPGESITKVSGTSNVKLQKSISESSIPEDLSNLKAAVPQGPLLTIEATKDQNDINGQLSMTNGSVKFKASRNAFSTFFGKRWINRSLNYFGIKIKL